MGGAQVAVGQMRLEGGCLGIVQNAEEIRTGGVVPGPFGGSARGCVATGATGATGAAGAAGAAGVSGAGGTGRPEPERLPLVVAHAVIPLSSRASFIERSA